VGPNAEKRVLVTGVSGGVGVWVMQLAKLAGCEVVGRCGPDNVEFMKSCVAVEAVNYRMTSLKSWVKEDESGMLDVVIGCVGKSSLEDAWGCQGQWCLGWHLSAARTIKAERTGEGRHAT
jgi:NADPH:quinone reductase-like Zn-dependent oxidoreductase